MKKNGWVVLLIVIILVVAAAVAKQNKNNSSSDFYATCDEIAKVLKSIKIEDEKFEKILPCKTIQKIKKIQTDSLQLIKDAKEIGPTKKGYNKLEKGTKGAESLIEIKRLFILSTVDQMEKEWREFEKIPQENERNKKNRNLISPKNRKPNLIIY